MFEEDIELNENPQDLLPILLKENSIDEFDQKGYKIIYFGEKSSSYLDSLLIHYPIDETNIDEVQSHLNNIEDTRNYILYMKYKNIYIGGLSIFDFQSKEGFGLYKYPNSPDKSFYLGQWEENIKNGKGFLKIDKNHLYIGTFKNNQMEGEGLYYNKKNGNYYYGLFSYGVFKKGLYCNLLKDIFYIGEFENNKKNDDFCCYFNKKNNKMFFGEIKNDLFIKGNIIFLLLTETEKSFNINIEKIIYYDSNNKDDSPTINKKKITETFERIICEVILTIDNIKSFLQKGKIFDELEEAYDDESYNNGIGRYNNYENQFSFEKDFMDNYNYYLGHIKEYLDKIKIEEIKKKIMI